jgi:hypothetical protein
MELGEKDAEGGIEAGDFRKIGFLVLSGVPEDG